jgi:hypothetical protein
MSNVVAFKSNKAKIKKPKVVHEQTVFAKAMARVRDKMGKNWIVTKPVKVKKKKVAVHQSKPLVNDKAVVSSGLTIRPAIDKVTGRPVKVAFDPETGEAIAALQTSLDNLKDWMPPGFQRRFGEGEFMDNEYADVGGGWRSRHEEGSDDTETTTLVDESTGETKDVTVRTAVDKKTGAVVKLAIDPATGQPIAAQSVKKKSAVPTVATAATLWWLLFL